MQQCSPWAQGSVEPSACSGWSKAAGSILEMALCSGPLQLTGPPNCRLSAKLCRKSRARYEMPSSSLQRSRLCLKRSRRKLLRSKKKGEALQDLAEKAQAAILKDPAKKPCLENLTVQAQAEVLKVMEAYTGGTCSRCKSGDGCLSCSKWKATRYWLQKEGFDVQHLYGASGAVLYQKSKLQREAKLAAYGDDAAKVPMQNTAATQQAAAPAASQLQSSACVALPSVGLQCPLSVLHAGAPRCGFAGQTCSFPGAVLCCLGCLSVGLQGTCL